MEECFLPLWWSQKRTLEANTRNTCLFGGDGGIEQENRTGEKKRHFLIQQTLACEVLIYQTVFGPSITYSLWFQCSFLQPQGIWTFWILLPLTHFYCQRQSLASSFCVTFTTSQHNCSQHECLRFLLFFCLISHSAFGYKTEETHNSCIVWSGNLFPQPQLEFTELNKQLSVKRFLHIETLALLYQLTILLPTAASIHGKKTLFLQ